MKIGIFTDSHYSSQEITCGNRYNNKSLQKIKQAYDVFETEKCELVICLGDLIDKENSHTREIENLKEVAQIIKVSNIPSICVMGNHDAFAFEVDEFYGILGDDCVPKDISIDNKNLLFLDACFFKSGAHYKPGDSDWTDTYYPDAVALENKLFDIVGDTYIFMHQNIDPAIHKSHRLYNADELCEIIEKC